MWKKGKGRLGIFEPLLGEWQAEASSELGPVTCQRRFDRILSRAWVQLAASWQVGGRVYDEIALFGIDGGKALGFWSFTSDGKMSQGVAVNGEDIHPEAIAFEARMPAGVARMAYFPGDRGELMFIVEARSVAGWKRFVTHSYRRP